MLTYQNAADAPNPDVLVSYALPWVLAAGNPYYEWLFGGADQAMRVLDIWMKRASSEVSTLLVESLLYESEIVGGFIALGGLELRKARKADTVALLTAVAAADRAALMCRLANVRDLFYPVADDEYYLSKMGLYPRFRGKGFGRALVMRYLEEGENRGYTGYRLDVHAENEAAIRCYQGCGFQISNRTQDKDGTLKYYSMRYSRETR